MITASQQLQLDGFNAAKEIALNINKGQSRRARVNNMACNYTGYKNGEGRCFVIGDSDSDLQNCTIEIMGKPAREVFEGFSMMSK